MLTMLIAIGAMLVAAASAFAVDSLSYRFDEEGRREVFRGRFVIAGDAGCVLDVVWEPRHLARYESGVDSVRVISAIADTQMVRYWAHWWFVHSVADYRRVLRRAEGRVDFTLITSSGSGAGVPRVLESHGSYAIVPRDSGCAVEYEERATLESSLFAGLARREARRRVVVFLRVLARYLGEQCERAAPPEAATAGQGGAP
jgi:hypothetical protein